MAEKVEHPNGAGKWAAVWETIDDLRDQIAGMRDRTAYDKNDLEVLLEDFEARIGLLENKPKEQEEISFAPPPREKVAADNTRRAENAERLLGKQRQENLELKKQLVGIRQILDKYLS